MVRILDHAPVDGKPESEAAVLAPQAWISRCSPPLRTHAVGPLAGLTFAVKDNMDVAGMPTTAGCPAFAFTPKEHAVVVQKLLAAGATLIGKTNLDQFACGLNGSRSPYGAVPNAFNAAYVSGGSSSGSAYVVATGQVDFALGTDTAGSGRVPAGLNNIVGMKPSKGLVSTRGVLPAAQSVDCVSVFARTVDVAAKVLGVLAGYDAQDAYSRQLDLKTEVWGASFKFGVPTSLNFFGDALAEAAFEKSIQQLKALGGMPVAIDYAPLAAAADLLYNSALVAERYQAIQSFFDAHESEVIEPVRSIIAKGRDYSAADLYAAQTQLQAYGQQAAAMWDGIDVLLVPTAPTHYTVAQMQADPVVLNRNLGEYTNFVNLLDYAAIAVPSSMRADGLPFGVTLIGPCGSDWQLAELGQRLHQKTGLKQGNTGLNLPVAQSICARAAIKKEASTPIAVVGAHLTGMPLNGQLTERGATLLQATSTAAHYRLYALPNTTPPKPGLKRVATSGAAIAVEVWDMPTAQVGSFLALIPAPLGLGKVELADGSWVTGFVCEGFALDAALDVTLHGGWRAYIHSLKK
jgi:allophanate hydrolase